MKIIDAHLHIGQPGVFFAPETTAEQLISRMDRLGIGAAVCTDHKGFVEGAYAALPVLRKVYQQSGGRISYLASFNPNRSDDCLRAMQEELGQPGFVGMKIHPSFHRIAADSPAYEVVWRFAAEHNMPIMTHSWSVSDYNPVQQFSTPARFESYARAFPGVRFVLGHTGGRGREQADAMRMAREHANVYVDISGDVFCYRLIERLVENMPVEKILFGTDYPWLDLRANLTRVLLASIDDTAKERILGLNAQAVYRLNEKR